MLRSVRQLPTLRARPAGGWSLIELLVACVLAAALLAIAIPFAIAFLGRGELAATEENVASELLQARAEAQKSGRPVEVLLESDPGRLILRYFDPTARLLDSRTSSSRSAERNAWRREASIDRTVRVETDSDVRRNGSGSAGPTRVAIFMPDGSLLFAASLLLMHESGLSSRVSVDPYTGHPAIERSSGDEVVADGRPDDEEF